MQTVSVKKKRFDGRNVTSLMKVAQGSWSIDAKHSCS